MQKSEITPVGGLYRAYVEITNGDNVKSQATTRDTEEAAQAWIDTCIDEHMAGIARAALGATSQAAAKKESRAPWSGIRSLLSEWRKSRGERRYLRMTDQVWLLKSRRRWKVAALALMTPFVTMLCMQAVTKVAIALKPATVAESANDKFARDFQAALALQLTAPVPGMGGVGNSGGAEKASLEITKIPAQFLAAYEDVRMNNSLAFGGEQKIVSFSDPICPACRRLEPELDGLKSPYGVTIVPVAFQEGAVALAATVMCMKPFERVAAWKKAAAGTLVADTSPCVEGMATIKANNAVFIQLGMTQTPTLVSPAGNVSPGVTTSADIQKIIDKG